MLSVTPTSRLRPGTFSSTRRISSGLELLTTALGWVDWWHVASMYFDRKWTSDEKEPTDDQLTNILYKYLAQHAEVDEVCFGALLAELVHDHPLRRMMEE
jgi:hypothetical protein